MKKNALIALIIALSASSPALALTPVQPEDFLLEPMPQWYREGFSRGHLNIPILMEQGFSRLEAVEIQNQMKDALLADPEYLQWEKSGLTPKKVTEADPKVINALKQAIERVQSGYFESGFQPQKLQAHEFYVAFDLDETLLSQWYQQGENGHADLNALPRDYILHPEIVGPDYVSLTPGWQQAFDQLSQIPGCKGVIVFTAKEDRAAHAIMDRLMYHGKPLRHFLKGVFTRNHLVRDSKSVKLSKDLRVIDESLEHVILIDDNPTRVFPAQKANLREFPKYNPDLYFHTRTPQKARQFFEKLLPTVVFEIAETAAYSQKHRVSFKHAYYPYSMAGSAELLMLLKQGYSPQEAHGLLRQHPDWFEPEFYIPGKQS